MGGSLSTASLDDGMIIGLGSIDKASYLIYVDSQRKGLVTAICNQMEKVIQGNIITCTSITAKAFEKVETIK